MVGLYELHVRAEFDVASYQASIVRGIPALIVIAWKDQDDEMVFSAENE